MKTLITILLTLILAIPAYAYRPYPYYGNPYYRQSPPAGYWVGVGAVGAAALAALLIGNEVRSRNEAEIRMLAGAVRANQYENYLIGMQYFNAYTRRPVTPFSREKWIQWRINKGLEYIP